MARSRALDAQIPSKAPIADQAVHGGAPASIEGKSKPDTWWKWVLVYPTLAISVLSAIPTYVEFAGSTWLGLPFGQYKTALKENELWKQNIDCAALPFDGLKNQHNIEVDAVICQSGTVLVRVKPPEKKTTYKWVPLDSTMPDRAASLFMSSAHAAEREMPQGMGGQAPQGIRPPGLPGMGSESPPGIKSGKYVVLCQNWIDNSTVRRRINDQLAGQCFDEVVNTFSGKVIRTSSASCHC